jgi:hypothetical protein
MRHKFLEWTVRNKRATFDSTFGPFQSDELFLHRVLPSRADVRFAQHNKFNQLTQFIEQTRLEQTSDSLKQTSKSLFNKLCQNRKTLN